MKRFAAVLLVLMLPALSGRADSYMRQSSIDITHYKISLDLTDRSDTIIATAGIDIVLRSDHASGMWLDLAGMKVDRLRVGGIETPFTHQNERLSFNFDREYGRDETVAIQVDYHGTVGDGGVGLNIGTNRYGSRVFFSDNWPEFARHWFPSIDHPSDKASVDFIITAPEKYTVVANGHLVQISSLPDGRKRTHWTERHAIPTYSMSIGVADFSVHTEGTAQGIPVSWYVFRQDAAVAAQKFQRTSRMLQYFSGRIDPYPYEKLAHVESTTLLSAMEYANAIFYSESLFHPAPISEDPVPHEIVHQWFGNSVTPADWDHLWLSEGFATYFDALFYAQGRTPVSLKDRMAGYADILFAYPPARLRPVIDPAQKDLMEKLNPLNYEKGAWILHMLRGIVGDEAFFDGIASYYRMYRDGNVWTDDFRKVMESAGGKDLSTFFRQWLYQPGWPEYRLSWSWNRMDRVAEIRILQVQTGELFDIPLNMVLSSAGGEETHRIRIQDREQEFRIPCSSPPASIKLDPDGWVLKSLSGGAK